MENKKVLINSESFFNSNLAHKWANRIEVNGEHFYNRGDYVVDLQPSQVVSEEVEEYFNGSQFELVVTTTTLDGVRTTTTEHINCSCAIVATLVYKNGELFPITLDSQLAIQYYFSTLDCDEGLIDKIVFTEK